MWALGASFACRQCTSANPLGMELFGPNVTYTVLACAQVVFLVAAMVAGSVHNLLSQQAQ